MSQLHSQTTAITPSYISHTQLTNALNLRDLSDQQQGAHAMQRLIEEIEQVLMVLMPTLLIQRCQPKPLVCIRDNYDALGYPAEGAAREARYSRYLDNSHMLRTQMSSAMPSWLRSWRTKPTQPIAILHHGLVYRRDCIDRWHCPEPHQLDLWLITPKQQDSVSRDELWLRISHAVLGRTLPKYSVERTATQHPYTENGEQLDIKIGHREYIEIGEGGLINAQLLAQHGWDPEQYHGIALGLGLDRLLMLRKGIPDIRLLRDPEPRVQQQMQDLALWKAVSRQPKTERDLSLVVDSTLDMDLIGETVRETLGGQSQWVEELKLLSTTPYEQLPPAAQQRLGMQPHHVNQLLRIVLRHPTKSIPTQLANEIRNRVYLALNQGIHHLA